MLRKSFVFLIILFITHWGYTAPKLLEPNWGAFNATAKATIDHRTWQHLLTRYLHKGPDNVNLFRYDSVTPQDKIALNAYLEYLQSLNIQQYNREQQLAYWINLYNAKIISIVLDYYPVDSITSINLSNNPFEIGPFSTKTLHVLGYPLSLRDINLKILHKFWHDPRIVFTLNAAAIGSPNLSTQAYEGHHIEQLLEDATFNFINSPRAVQINYHRLSISKIFKWYRQDFGNNDAAIIQYLRQYATPKLSQELINTHHIAGSFFDWSLNG